MIIIKFSDEKGKEREKTFSGFEAAISEIKDEFAVRITEIKVQRESLYGKFGEIIGACPNLQVLNFLGCTLPAGVFEYLSSPIEKHPALHMVNVRVCGGMFSDMVEWILRTKTDVQVFVNGERQALLVKDDMEKMPLEIGQNLNSVVDAQGTEDVIGQPEKTSALSVLLGVLAYPKQMLFGGRDMLRAAFSFLTSSKSAADDDLPLLEELDRLQKKEVNGARYGRFNYGGNESTSISPVVGKISGRIITNMT